MADRDSNMAPACTRCGTPGAAWITHVCTTASGIPPLPEQTPTDLIIEAVERLRVAIEKALDEYGTDRDWQKMRAYEMAELATSEAAVELVQLAKRLGA